MARSSIDVAAAEIENGKMNQLPNIGVDMTGMYLSDISLYENDWSKITREDIPNFGHQFNASLNQLLYSGGKVNKAIDMAKLNEQLAQHQFVDAEQNIKLTAAQLYINLYQLYNQKEILDSNMVLARRRLRNVTDFYNQDMVTKNDVLRAEVFNSQLKQNILQIDNAIEVINKNLLILAGLDESTMIIPDVANLQHEVDSQNELYFRNLAQQNSPLVSISSTQIALAEKNLELTRSELQPTIAAFAGYGFTRPLTSSSPVLDYYANSYQVGLNISYNVESLFKNRKKTAVNKIQIEQARQAKEATLQQIESDISSAYKNYELVVEQKRVSEINEAAASENYRITEYKYQNQLVTMVELIDASNTKLQAEFQTLSAEMDIILNYIKILQITGQL
jgi:outer membrane protein TolC